MDGTIETYDERRSPLLDIPYRVPTAHRFSDAQREELTARLNVGASPYREYGRFLDEVRAIAASPELATLREVCTTFRRGDLAENPALLLSNCPTGHVPMLSFEDPLASKHEIKTEFVAEAFLGLLAELQGTSIITYRTANRGDMFHDIIPMKTLEFTITQKTVNTLHFHCDLPDNKVRPDWVNLLAMRNSPLNEVYTPIVRVKDVLGGLDAKTLAVLREPIFHVPLTVVEGNISNYGRADTGHTEPRALVVEDRGYTFFAYHEGCTTSTELRGREALVALEQLTHRLKHNVFLEERDFMSISNNTAMHARHVVKVTDMEAHRRRWLMKTWNVDDVELHRQHMVPGRFNTADE